MSTFGKKALVWWDYEDHTKLNVIRYMHTSLELQLKLLEKWYPIGMQFRKNKPDAANIHALFWQKDRIYKIIGYKQYINYWAIEYDLSGQVYNNNLINPVLTIPLKEHIITIQRENKLEKLFRK